MKIRFFLKQAKIKFAKILLREDTKNGLDIVSVPVTNLTQFTESNFRFNLTIMAIFKNESVHIIEWLAFHVEMGVEHFYLYDNQSEDGTKEKLAPYIQNGLVTVIDWPSNFGNGGQVLALNHAIGLFSKESRWMAHIDIDEFIFPEKDNNLAQTLERLENFDCIMIKWRCFGPATQISSNYSSVLKTFTMMADLGLATESMHYELTRTKAIFKPQKVSVTKVHGCITNEKSTIYDEHGILLNHYITRSREEFEIKIMRAHPWSNTHVLQAWRRKRIMMFEFLSNHSVPNFEILRFNKGRTD